MVKEVLEKLKADKPALSPLRIWQAYEQLETVAGKPKNELIALVSLIRKVAGIDVALTPYDKTVDQNFQEWAFRKQAGALKFSEEQMHWLRIVKDYVSSSFHVAVDDFDLSPVTSRLQSFRLSVCQVKYHAEVTGGFLLQTLRLSSK